jgi:two-component system sensor histidine kinase VicK
MQLRTKILLAIVGTLLVSDALVTWVVLDRFQAGAQREVASQAEARADQVQALIDERTSTLEKEGEAISLYPAVIQALVGNNPTPLMTWSGQVANLQGTSVTVTDPQGTVVARGHAPDQHGDDLSGRLDGLRQALAGQRTSGVEGGDELGLALRGYVPVFQSGLSGPIVGAVMIAQPFDRAFIDRLTGSQAGTLHMQVVSNQPSPADNAERTLCAPAVGSVASCSVPLRSPSGVPLSWLAFDVPLQDIQQAQSDAARGLWLTSLLVLLLGILAAWLLARSLTRPLARLMAASDRLGSGNLDQPVDDVRSSDEIGRLAQAFERMRARIARATAEIRDERDVLDAVLESAGEGILMTDERGKTVVANRTWTELAGAPTLAAAGRFRTAEQAEESFAAAAARWMADPERVAGADFERPEPYQRLRVYTAPVRHRSETIIGRIFVLRDVTRETEAERMRSALVATVSHELRSPLTAISGYTDTLLHEGPWDEDTQHEFLEAVLTSAQRLSALVDNLLDAASLEAGVLRLQPEPIRVERIAERVLAQRRLLAGTCTLELETRAGLPLVIGDGVRIEQVLTNLVDNAIKYSPNGGVVHVRLARTADGDLAVSVSDQGVGIPPEHVPHLFERFYRITSNGRSVKGVGLGLYICRSLIEAHGGRIWVESQPGVGSTFIFTLPASREPTEDALPGATTPVLSMSA